MDTASPLPSTELDAIAYAVAHPDEIEAELARWERTARPKQLRPPDTRLWLLHTGRGWGKTRTAAEDARRAIDAGARELLAIGPTGTDVHDVMVPMILQVMERAYPGQVQYRRSTEAPSVIANGATIHLRSGQRVDRCRGLGVAYVWADEIDSWKPEQMKPWEAWVSVVEPTCRIGRAEFTITSTPKRGGLIAKLTKRSDARVVTGHTRENQANLATGFVENLSEAFAGSWLERQELGGEIVEDIYGALVTRKMIEESRVAKAPQLGRIVVGVDPSGGAAEQGIVAVGKSQNGHLYVLQDRSCLLGPDGWGRRVVETYDGLAADRIVAEANYGGAMVESTILTVDRNAAVKLVTASRGKHVRFEPVAALYAQGRLHHVGRFDELEDEVTSFTPDGYEGTESPNRADALVWAVLDLMPPAGLSAADLYGDSGAYHEPEAVDGAA